MISRIAPLPSRALVAVGGPDRKSFLQGLLTQDVETLAPGELRFGALLTPQGRLMFDLFLFEDGETVMLDVAADRRDALVQRLTMYRLRSKVEIVAAEAAVHAAWGEPLPAGALAEPRVAELGGRLYGPAEPNATEADYDAFRLDLGVPDPAKDARPDSAYPIELDFDQLNGIDFRKGCFVGQETTSRMKRRGVIKTRAVPISFEGPPPPFGAEILVGDLRAGEVLWGIEGRAMALVRLDRVEAGHLTVDGRPVWVEWPHWLIAP
jgi:folate-binding protein YgfZ